jgi:hypothetical protein
MKTTLLSLTFIALASAASATTCDKIGLATYVCGVSGQPIKVDANSSSEAQAKASAVAAQLQGQAQGQNQSQGQGQTQTSSNDNSNSSTNTNTNGGNSVSIDGNPAVTLGVGINFSVPIASGVQTRNAIETANWFLQNGDRCTAFHIMSKAPRVRALKVNFTCGDKG